MKILRLLVIACALPLTGCETLTAIQRSPITQGLETAAFNLGKAYLDKGGNVDAMWGIQQGLFAVNTVLKSNHAAGIEVEQTARDFSGDPAAVALFAESLGKIAKEAPAKTPEERKTMVQQIASGVSTAASRVQFATTFFK